MKIKIGKESVLLFGKVKGSNSCKFNRIAKLAVSYNDNLTKMDGIISRGLRNVTLNTRLALATKLLMTTGIRVGNEGSAEGYMTIPHPNSKKKPEFVQTYGLTTLTKEHVKVRGTKVSFQFTGKSSVENTYDIDCPKTAKQVKEVLSASENTFLDITPYELTKFIKRYIGKQFSPKDFRTLRANVEATSEVGQILKTPLPRTRTELNAELKQIATHVSQVLNNTPSVCKKSYIDEHLMLHFIGKRW